MHPLDLQKAANLEAVQPVCPDCDITKGYTSDLLSDVVANAPSDSVLITIQAHKNTIAVATLAGIRAIIICNNRPVPSDMVEAAAREGIAIFRTPESQFAVSHKVFEFLAHS